MPKFKKGSAAAKAYMAKLRAARGKKNTPGKKVGYRADRTTILTRATPLIKKYQEKGYTRPEAIKAANLDVAQKMKSTLFGTKKPNSTHKDTKSHNVNIRVMSGTKKTKKYSIGKVNYTKLLTDIAKENKLNAAVVRSIKSHAKDYGTGVTGIEGYISDVLRAGGQSGIISELIYYSDTTAWFKKYNSEISKLLRYTMEEFGYDSPSDLFGNNWDKYDPFSNDTQNIKFVI
jgi:hypothetical protein